MDKDLDRKKLMLIRKMQYIVFLMFMCLGFLSLGHFFYWSWGSGPKLFNEVMVLEFIAVYIVFLFWLYLQEKN